MKIIIVGSGLAGLTAASILRPFHDVTVYERGNATIATGGQGIILTPNGVRILDQIHFDARCAGPICIEGLRIYDKLGKVVLEDFPFENFQERFGAECPAMKRSDFRDELLILATMSSVHDDSLSPVELVCDVAVINVDPEAGTVTLEDGRVEFADVIIVADGIHSRLRSKILQSTEYSARLTRLTCYRVAVSTEDAQRALNDIGLPLPHWWDPATCANRSSLIPAGDGTARVVTVYPIRDRTMFNLSCIVRTDEVTTQQTSVMSSTATALSSSWNADANSEEMLSHFSDFGPELKAILSAAAEVKIWHLQDLNPLPFWTRGNTILIGDAAHAMTPMQGQGANMSIEDAEALSLLNQPIITFADVPEILKTIEKVRMPRLAMVMGETRKSHGLNGVAERFVRNLEMNCGFRGVKDALGKLEMS